MLTVPRMPATTLPSSLRASASETSRSSTSMRRYPNSMSTRYVWVRG